MRMRVAQFIFLSILAVDPFAVALADGSGWRVVNYWSEWCAPCRVEIPMFNELNVMLKGTGVAIVGVNFDEDPREATLAIAEELGIEFPTLTQDEVDLLAMRPPSVMPTTYILTPDNEIAAKLIGMQSKESLLKEFARLGIGIGAN